MSILSTLRPLSSRFLDILCWIIDYLSGSGERQTTFNDLNDDILLLLLETLSVPQLLHLRSVSRRLCYLIEHYRLPLQKTLLYGYKKAERRKLYIEQANFVHQEVKVYVSPHFHAYSEFNQPRRLSLCDHSSFFCHPRRLFPGKLSTFPLSLPSLLPRLASLTFTNFLVDLEELPNEVESTVNRLLAHYLRSSWADSLVSLHLFLEVPSKPTPYYGYFCLLSKLSVLKHLNLDLSRYVAQNPATSSLLPDSIPVLSQLISFSLANYGGQNTAILLAQLGSKLTYLSLWDVACSVEDYAAFFASKPTYSQTLKRVEVLLHDMERPDGNQFLNLDWRIFTLTTQHLFSLERAVINFHSSDGDLVSFFANLKCLKHLREFSGAIINLEQFRAFRLQHNLHRHPLPKLPALRRIAIFLFTSEADFEESELTDGVLPLLDDVFCNLDFLNIAFTKLRPGGGVEYSEPHSLQLLSWASQRFKGLRECFATYYL